MKKVLIRFIMGYIAFTLNNATEEQVKQSLEEYIRREPSKFSEFKLYLVVQVFFWSILVSNVLGISCLYFLLCK